MTIRSTLAATLPAVLLALAPAGAATAKGACVYVSVVRGQKAVRCADGVPNQDVCNRKAITGEGKFHPDQKCSELDYAFHPGPGPIPPPAKVAEETPAKVNDETKPVETKRDSWRWRKHRDRPDKGGDR